MFDAEENDKIDKGRGENDELYRNLLFDISKINIIILDIHRQMMLESRFGDNILTSNYYEKHNSKLKDFHKRLQLLILEMRVLR